MARHSGPCVHAEIAVRLGCQIARQFPPSPSVLAAASTSWPGESWREASFFAAYVTIVGCMILYGLRMIDQQLDEPIDESEADLE